MDKYIKGNCENMCPPSEILIRSKEKIIHFYEQNKITKTAERERFITEFSRSAAGNKTPSSFELRTKNALNRTIKYLLTEIFQDTRRPFFYCYDFMFDRFRAIRQEIVMQNFDTKTTIELLEPIIMFLAYSSYKLCMEPVTSFDPKMCKQHLQECLKKVLSCYDILDLSSDLNEKYSNSNRCFMESLYLLINFGSSEALSRSISVPKEIRDPTLKLSLLISLEFWRGNYYKVLSLMDRLPHVLCAVASLNIQMIRRQMLITFANGFNNKMLPVPLTWLQKVLIYQQEKTLKSDLSYYNIEVVKEGVVFNKSSIDLKKPLIQHFYLEFVNKKLKNINLSEVLLLMDLDNITRMQNLSISS